jgi:hypothetical protein
MHLDPLLLLPDKGVETGPVKVDYALVAFKLKLRGEFALLPQRGYAIVRRQNRVGGDGRAGKQEANEQR